MRYVVTCILLLLGLHASSQTNVRGWYAKGQVWVVWEVDANLPETFAIYSSAASFAHINQAELTGRLFKEEYFPGALRQQVDIQANYKIPDGLDGTYQLLQNEALFVYTPDQSGALWFAVVEWGSNAVINGQNITDAAVSFLFDPINDPVQCHLQYNWSSSDDFVSYAYYMWADGKQNHWEGRNDFPVMANKHKNGMPSMFIVSARETLNTMKSITATIWLQGGDGNASECLPEEKPIVNIRPQDGILVAHNDDLFGYLLSAYSGFDSHTSHFGWRKTYDPFTPNDMPLPGDTIINYTQRRYLWIDAWLNRHWNVDSNRININGHGEGARGATALAKRFPSHYGSATIYSNGFLDDDLGEPSDILFGPAKDDYPTNLINREGKVVRMSSTLINITDRTSIERDLPLFRVFSGKNDVSNISEWDSVIVAQYDKVDSIGWGMQLYWSERSYEIESGIPLDDHWFNGVLFNQQTAIDNVAIEETLRSDRSFPAFFNHQRDLQNNDPGDGTPGTGINGIGDDWGTWGGYHKWDMQSIIDEPSVWTVTAWLEGNAFFPNDNSPEDVLTADLAIRKPQQFKPTTGTKLIWTIRDFVTNNVLHFGVVNVLADDLVVLPNVRLFSEDIRKVIITLEDPPSSLEDDVNLNSNLNASVFPNPSSNDATLWLEVSQQESASIMIFQNGGTIEKSEVFLEKGMNTILLKELKALPPGIYFIKVSTASQNKILKWIRT